MPCPVNGRISRELAANHQLTRAWAPGARLRSDLGAQVALELVERVGPAVAVQLEAGVVLELALAESDFGRIALRDELEFDEGLDVIEVRRIPHERVRQAAGRVDDAEFT